MPHYQPIEKYDLVAYKDYLENEGKCLHCATFIYKRAVVWSIDPLVLVSEIGDMVWSSTVELEDFKMVGKASEIAIAAVNNRMECSNKDYKIENENPGISHMYLIPGFSW